MANQLAINGLLTRGGNTMTIKASSELKQKRKIHPNDIRFVEQFDFDKASAESIKRLSKRPFHTT